jgi:hypothetical protein
LTRAILAFATAVAFPATKLRVPSSRPYSQPSWCADLEPLIRTCLHRRPSRPAPQRILPASLPLH